jgi:hypothetical protein
MLNNAIQYEQHPKEFKSVLVKTLKAEDPSKSADLIEQAAQEWLDRLPKLKENYQPWYTEVRALLKQVLPDRLTDFAAHYEKPKNRKSISYENYRIEDYMQGLRVTFGADTRADPTAAMPHLQQQIAILNSAVARFESSLFEIKQLVQADLLDSEVEAARELLKHRFTRAAGAVAGVVLERHLVQVCENHAVKVTKKNPSLVS